MAFYHTFIQPHYQNHTHMKQAILLFLFFNLAMSLSAQDVKAKLTEVYGDKAQEVFNSDPERIKIFTELLQNRLSIVKQVSTPDDKLPKLSQVALLNKYNPALQRDKGYDPETFNPLKYNLNFFPKATTMYRIDNTDYVIVIEPQSFNRN